MNKMLEFSFYERGQYPEGGFWKKLIHKEIVELKFTKKGNLCRRASQQLKFSMENQFNRIIEIEIGGDQ